MRLSPCRSGVGRVGSTKKTRAAGFSGIAATTWAGDAWTTNGRSNAGARCAGMLSKSRRTVRPARSIAGRNRDKHCFTGLTIRASSSVALCLNTQRLQMVRLPSKQLSDYPEEFEHLGFRFWKASSAAKTAIPPAGSPKQAWRMKMMWRACAISNLVSRSRPSTFVCRSGQHVDARSTAGALRI